MFVSNTEITSFSTCKRAHYYRFIVSLEPKEHVLSKALYRGIVGHRVWEQYYLVIKDGGSVDDAKAAGMAQVKAELETINMENPESYDMAAIVVEVGKLFEVYVEVYRTDIFEPIEVETVFSTNMAPGIDYGLRLDLLGEITKGEFRGDLAVIDHKFLYNFKTTNELDMDGQLPKYISTVADSGYTVTKGIFNQIRYRSLKNPEPSNLFAREWIKVKPTETARIWQDQTQVAEEIATMKELPHAEAERKATRNMSPYICRSCYFKKLCKLELNGQSITNAVAMDYQPNTYGYGNLMED